MIVLERASLITGDPSVDPVEGACVAIEGDRIVHLGPANERAWRSFGNARHVDLAGHLISPGLVNVHTHAVLTMVRGIAEDLGFAPAYTPGIPQGHMVLPDEAVALARLGALEAMLSGSTLINDTYVHADLTLPAMAELGLRVSACGRIHDVAFAGIPEGRWEHDPRIGEATLGNALALAERWHGAEDGRLAVQLAAHAPDTCSDELLYLIAGASADRGLRVATHLSQSRVENDRVRERSGCTPTELLEAVGLLNERLIAAHCIHVSDTDVARIGRAGVHVAHVPKGNATHGAIAPTLRLRAAGARLALATDNMHGDMVETMRWALAMARLQAGGITDAWQPETVHAMATRAGAAAMGEDARLGRLAPGLKADLVAFDLRRAHLTPAIDPLGTLVHAGRGGDVAMVMVDGRIVVEGGHATLVDEERIRRDASMAAVALWERAGGAARWVSRGSVTAAGQC